MQANEQLMSPSDALKSRILRVKHALPRNYKRTFLDRFPEFDNIKGINKLNNVVTLKIADEEITSALEAIARESAPDLFLGPKM